MLHFGRSFVLPPPERGLTAKAKRDLAPGKAVGRPDGRTDGRGEDEGRSRTEERRALSSVGFGMEARCIANPLMGLVWASLSPARNKRSGRCKQILLLISSMNLT